MTTDRSLPAVAWWPILTAAAVKLAATLWTISEYGYFRDELYYLACARHLDWGYVDHPALSIVILWPIVHVLGTSLVAIRIVPALVGVATILVVAGIAREMGGRGIAQGLAATAALIAPDFLGVAHVYSMNVFDTFFWGLTALVVARLIRTGDRRWWVAIGLVLCLGLANKISVLWLGAGLGAGVLLTPERQALRSRSLWLGGAMALAGGLPYLIWNFTHDWATREFVHNATSQKMVAVSVGAFIKGQLDTIHPFNLPIVLGGLGYLLLHRDGSRFRLLAWTYISVAVLLVANGTSRSGYLSPAYTWVLAAGGVAVEALVVRWRPLIRRSAVSGLVALQLAGGALAAPFALPLLPVATYLRHAQALGVAPKTEEKKDLGALPQEYADMHGWTEMVASINAVVASLPADERMRVRVLAPDYGVAGALDLFGPADGLAPAISGHNNYWLWGPDGYDGTGPLIVVGGSRERVSAAFDVVDHAGAVECGLCMPYENHRPIWIARQPKMPIPALWARLKHYE